uniref:Uncharacterized protein n=1 Tax=Hucho hucho TaxID=62062 RepID=A0A4W5KLT8_9TELE
LSLRVFLSGVGKTTLVQKAYDDIVSSGVSVEGFYTQEIREGRRRVGFDVVTVTGQRVIQRLRQVQDFKPFSMYILYFLLFKSSQTLFATCAEYNKCRLYREMLTDKPLTNSSVQEDENVTKENRDVILTEVVSALKDCLKQSA